MRRSKLYLTLVFCVLYLSVIDGQIIKKFSLELGINRAKVFNTKEIISYQPSVGNGFSDVNIQKEAPSYSTNYSFALRYNFMGKHFIGLKYSQNTLGSLLTGSVEYFSDIGSNGPIVLNNSHNKVDSRSWGIIYEYYIPISKGKITFALGVENQDNSYHDSFIVVPGISSNNYNGYSAIGFIYPILKYTSLHTKLFATQSFANSTEIPTDVYESSYVPLQVGLELGVRFHFDKDKVE